MRNLRNAAVLALLALLLSSVARAEVELFPESRDAQYRTFGLFIDNQTSALFMPPNSKAWLALAEELPFFEFKNWFGSPQLMVFASINAGDRMNDTGKVILAETMDIRAGLSYEFSFDDKHRMAISWEHQSGHTSDDVPDQDIVHPNLGNEVLMFRYFHDIEDRFRLGGTLKPYMGIDPGQPHWGSDEFIEWFPWGTASSFDKVTPFIAGGLEQYGADQVRMTYHAQAGAYIGNHMKPVYKPNVRFAGGYYNGVDPRLKYAQFKLGLSRFYYFGFQVGL